MHEVPFRKFGVSSPIQKVGAYSYMLDLCGLTANKIAGEVLSAECLVQSEKKVGSI